MKIKPWQKPEDIANPGQPTLVTTLAEAMAVLDRLRTAPLVVYDAETDGLDWRVKRIVGHVFTFGSAPRDTYYIPVRHGADYLAGNIIDHPDKCNHPFEVALNEISSTRRDLHWVGHNFIFDLMFLFGHGVTVVGTVEDTQVNDTLLDEHAASHSLEASCQHAGTTEKKGAELYKYLAQKFGGAPERKQMGNFYKLWGRDPMGFDYAAGDGTATWDLYQAQILACRADTFDDGEGNLEPIRILESKVTRVVYRMMKRGIKVDVRRLYEVISIVEDKLAEAYKALPKDINVNSPGQVKRFMEDQGMSGWPLTEKGNPSFDEEWLKTNAPGRAVLVVRKYAHLLSGFLLPLRDTHLFNGRVHATFHQMANDEFGTITGRFSCSGPNLQQVHKRNKEMGKLFRSIFIPDDGLDWIDPDLSQCEPRLLAHYSGSKVLISGYTSSPPVDAHQAVATAASIDRESGKRLNQTIITGGGKAKLVAMLGESGAEIYDAYFRAMPEVKKLQRRASDKMVARGYVISLLGRKSRLKDSSKGYLAINRLLQCGNADIIKQAMVRIDEEFEAAGDVTALLNTVHDALGMQGNMSDPVHYSLIMRAMHHMTDYGPDESRYSTFLTVPMAADYGIGKNWAEATYPDEKLTYGEGV